MTKKKKDISIDILSNITVHMKYARYLDKKQRRETWREITNRNKNMHIKKYPHLRDEITKAYKFVMRKEVLPSMRSMQFAGKSIEVAPNRVFNCAYLPIDDWRSFSEVMFLLLGGTGVGYSVQRHHVEKLPEIRKPNPERSRRFLVSDSIEGWADAVKALMKSYFYGGSTLRFDFSDIRPKGAKLVTSGGKAPGPRPLQECLVKINGMLSEKQDGDQLEAIEVHDLICHVADAVLAGGIRRAALISLFSADDNEMLSAKTGSWWEANPQRGRANNSAVLLRHRITKDYFMNLWSRVQASGAGEPGFYFSNDKDWGTNPCCEIGLRPYQFCNLTEVNVSNITSQQDLEERVRVAAFLGTLQAGYTDFHYLRPVWQRNTEKEALIGVSMTGIASGAVLAEGIDLSAAASVVRSENRRVAALIGINPAARTTCVKPAGTTSLTLGTSSGIHAWYDHYYIRRIRVGKNEAIYKYLTTAAPDMIEDDYFRPHDTAVISIPQASPENSILRTESALSLLRRIKKITTEWVKPGHVRGQNTHNVSATVSVRSSEWEDVGEWMWDNRHVYNGLSVLPFSENEHTYVQAPFESCSKETYDVLYDSLVSLDLAEIREETDETDLQGELACAGGMCEIK